MFGYRRFQIPSHLRRDPSITLLYPIPLVAYTVHVRDGCMSNLWSHGVWYVHPRYLSSIYSNRLNRLHWTRARRGNATKEPYDSPIYFSSTSSRLFHLSDGNISMGENRLGHKQAEREELYGDSD